MADKYRVLFKGKLMAGADQAAVQTALARMFKISEERAATMLSGRPVVIKKNVEREVANKYRQAFLKIGARIHIVAEGAVEPAPVAPTQPAAAAPPPQPSASSGEPDIDAPDWAVDEPGVQIVEAEVIHAPEIPDLDAAIEQVGAIIDHAPDVAPPQIDLSGLTMEPVGADIDEKKPLPDVSYDLSGLELDAPGVEIVHEEKPAPPNIDISKLKVVDE